METTSDAKLLRIFISSTDKFKHASLYEVIVYAAKRYGLAGATVLRGVMGYGGSSQISNTRFWEITVKLPMVVEIVDETEKIDRFFQTIKPYFDKIKNGCIVTMERATVVLYKTGAKKDHT
jgi:PII-like signaling protein